MSDIRVHSVEVINEGGGEVRIVLHGDLCSSCGERVRYWNSTAGGECACGCCFEAPSELLAESVTYGEGVRALLYVGLSEVLKARGEGLAILLTPKT